MPSPDPNPPTCTYCNQDMMLIYIECSDGSGYIAAWTCKCKKMIALALDKAIEAALERQENEQRIPL